MDQRPLKIFLEISSNDFGLKMTKPSMRNVLHCGVWKIAGRNIQRGYAKIALLTTFLRLYRMQK